MTSASLLPPVVPGYQTVDQHGMQTSCPKPQSHPTPGSPRGSEEDGVDVAMGISDRTCPASGDLLDQGPTAQRTRQHQNQEITAHRQYRYQEITGQQVQYQVQYQEITTYRQYRYQEITGHQVQYQSLGS
ncbi:unnamed protein product [Gadus morhua 'NCC']